MWRSATDGISPFGAAPALHRRPCELTTGASATPQFGGRLRNSRSLGVPLAVTELPSWAAGVARNGKYERYGSNGGAWAYTFVARSQNCKSWFKELLDNENTACVLLGSHSCGTVAGGAIIRHSSLL